MRSWAYAKGLSLLLSSALRPLPLGLSRATDQREYVLGVGVLQESFTLNVVGVRPGREAVTVLPPVF